MMGRTTRIRQKPPPSQAKKRRSNNKNVRSGGRPQPPEQAEEEEPAIVKSTKTTRLANMGLATQTAMETGHCRSRGGGTSLSRCMPRPFPDHMPRPVNEFFLRDEDPYRDSFRTALRYPYHGFVVDESVLDNNNDDDEETEETVLQRHLHDELRNVWFRHDITQPFGLGSKCAKTYVTRCLMGDPGTTYKYLGIRMFAHHWTNEIQTLREKLTKRTQYHLHQLALERSMDDDNGSEQQNRPLGPSTFDVCLINCMEASEKLKPFMAVVANDNDDDPKQPQQRPQPPQQSQQQPHRTAVSWHADSSLEHFSTIAVYQTLVPMVANGNGNDDDEKKAQKKKKTNDNNNKDRNNPSSRADKKVKNQKDDDNDKTKNEWSIGLRVAPFSEGPKVESSISSSAAIAAAAASSPMLAVSLPSNAAYYLLDDFNHHHQHTVLCDTVVPSVTRYSLTFRLLRQGGNVQYQLDRCRRIISNLHKKGSRVFRSEQSLLTELESEWLRQFYVQGQSHHDSLYNEWGEALRELWRYWSRLEMRTGQVIQFLTHAAMAAPGGGAAMAAPESSSSSFEEHQQHRAHQKKIKKARDQCRIILQREGITFDQLVATMIASLTERQTMRMQWHDRERDPVFATLPAHLRPMVFLAKFDDHQTTTTTTNDDKDHDETNDHNDPAAEGGRSPLPESLDAVIAQLQTLPALFLESSSSSTPRTTMTTEHQPAPPLPPDDDWPGWQQHEFALEMQSPWAEALLSGRKTIETRAYPLPRRLIGQRIAILQSPPGVPGHSALPDHIRLGKSSGGGDASDDDDDGGSSAVAARIVGWCTFGSMVEYKTRDQFERDRAKHLVVDDPDGKSSTTCATTSSSAYGWKSERSDFIIYGWVVDEYEPYNGSSSTTTTSSSLTNTTTNDDFSHAVRKKRSLFQLFHRRIDGPKKKKNKKKSSAIVSSSPRRQLTTGRRGNKNNGPANEDPLHPKKKKRRF